MRVFNQETGNERRYLRGIPQIHPMRIAHPIFMENKKAACSSEKNDNSK